jgi:type I restriction enzyme S subunit
MGNIQDGEIDWSDLVYTSDDEEIEKYKLNPRDVLFNRTNSPELVGKTAIYRGDRPAIFAGYLIKIHNFKELDSRYLNFCLNTIYAKDFCLKAKTDGVSQSNVNAQKLGKFEVPFCSLEEQLEIVRRVEAMFKLADAIEKRLAPATARAEKMTQAILAKAFRGQLVPTEAELARREGRGYEPASELSARIKSERESEKKMNTGYCRRIPRK